MQYMCRIIGSVLCYHTLTLLLLLCNGFVDYSELFSKRLFRISFYQTSNGITGSVSLNYL